MQDAFATCDVHAAFRGSFREINTRVDNHDCVLTDALLVLTAAAVQDPRVQSFGLRAGQYIVP